MNPKIVHMLFEVVEDETYYEISCVEGYIKYLDNQIKRLEQLDEYVEGFNSSTKPRDKKDFQELIDYSLHDGETIENYKTVLEEYRTATKYRQEQCRSGEVVSQSC